MQLTTIKEEHACYVGQLASEASAAQTNQADQLEASNVQHSAELSQLASQHHTFTECLQQQLSDTVILLEEERASHTELSRQEQKLMMSQVVTFLEWERDDLAMGLSESHDAAIIRLEAQHEQQLDSVQSTMLQQNMSAVENLSQTNAAAAQALIAQHAELAEDQSQLHDAQLSIQGLVFQNDVEQLQLAHADHLQVTKAEWELKTVEAAAAAEAAVSEGVSLAAQDSELARQCCQLERAAQHAAEVDMLRCNHQQHLAEIAIQHEADQAESLSHLTQALEQLSHEHAQILASSESARADREADQQEAFQQQLLDLSILHDSFIADVNTQKHEQLQAAQALHDAYMGQICSEHESALTKLQGAIEAERQLHSVQLINLQLDFEQTERQLTSELHAAESSCTASKQRHQELRQQLQVSHCDCR